MLCLTINSSCISRNDYAKSDADLITGDNQIHAMRDDKAPKSVVRESDSLI